MILIHKETADIYLVSYLSDIIQEHEVTFVHDDRLIIVRNMFDIPLSDFEIIGWI